MVFKLQPKIIIKRSTVEKSKEQNGSKRSGSTGRYRCSLSRSNVHALGSKGFKFDSSGVCVEIYDCGAQSLRGSDDVFATVIDYASLYRRAAVAEQVQGDRFGRIKVGGGKAGCCFAEGQGRQEGEEGGREREKVMRC